MSNQTFGPRRCRDSRKPSLGQCPQVAFYVCPTCQNVYVQINDKNLTIPQLSCCGEMVSRVVPQLLTDLDGEQLIDYKIVGGYNDNAIQVFWKMGITPRWCYLKTFTGGTLKYILPRKRSPLVFALADLDAFAYCDKDPCVECTFRCKRGFELFVYTEEKGLIQVPLDRMSPYWQVQSEDTSHQE